MALIEAGRGAFLHVLDVKSLEAAGVFLEQLHRVDAGLDDPEDVHLAEHEVGIVWLIMTSKAELPSASGLNS
jgi:hypothetical protein